MYFKSDKKESCYGCSSCKQKCPKQCIEMQEDDEGFLYPKINKKECIECNTCEKVCPYNDEKNNSFDTPNVYATYNKNEELRIESSSGGIFSELSKLLINKQGVVFGATFDKDYKVIHGIASTIEEYKKFKGSKYVQSDINRKYIEAQKLLKEDKKVLFSGTPCQIAGLKSFLGTSYEKLFTCDIICHGVPSPKVFSDYLKYMKKNNNDEIENINFRDKTYGWLRPSMKIEFNNKKYINRMSKDIYTKLFLTDIMLRPSCYKCKFTKIKRGSDITIGDFWGIDKKRPHLNDNKGTSLVLINTQKGKELFNEIKDGLIYEECSIEEAMQHNLHSPTKKNPLREKFFEDYNKKGFDKIINKYASHKLISRIFRKTKIILINMFK